MVKHSTVGRRERGKRNRGVLYRNINISQGTWYIWEGFLGSPLFVLFNCSWAVLTFLGNLQCRCWIEGMHNKLYHWWILSEGQICMLGWTSCWGEVSTLLALTHACSEYRLHPMRALYNAAHMLLGNYWVAESQEHEFEIVFIENEWCTVGMYATWWHASVLGLPCVYLDWLPKRR